MRGTGTLRPPGVTDGEGPDQTAPRDVATETRQPRDGDREGTACTDGQPGPAAPGPRGTRRSHRTRALGAMGRGGRDARRAVPSRAAHRAAAVSAAGAAAAPGPEPPPQTRAGADALLYGPAAPRRAAAVILRALRPYICRTAPGTPGDAARGSQGSPEHRDGSGRDPALPHGPF